MAEKEALDLIPGDIKRILTTTIPKDNDELWSLIQQTTQVHRQLEDRISRADRSSGETLYLSQLKKLRSRVAERLEELEVDYCEQNYRPVFPG